MAKGYDQHRERLEALSSLGRELVRRSGAKCELCSAAGVKLNIFEVPPAPDEPDIDHCIHICDICQNQIAAPKTMNLDHWRCLYEAVWSEVPAVQVMALRLAKRLGENEAWAASLVDEVYLTEETQAWLDSET